MVRLWLTPKKRSDLLILLGIALLALGAAFVYPPAGLLVAGAAAVLGGLFLVTNVEVEREPNSARPKRRKPRD